MTVTNEELARAAEAELREDIAMWFGATGVLIIRGPWSWGWFTAMTAGFVLGHYLRPHLPAWLTGFQRQETP